MFGPPKEPVTQTRPRVYWEAQQQHQTGQGQQGGREPGLEQSEPGRGAMVGGLALATRHTGTYLSHLLITIHHLTSSDADRRRENTEEKLK